MRLTQKSKYAVRALMELALDERDCPLGVAEIARRQRIPERFLEQIFGSLQYVGAPAEPSATGPAAPAPPTGASSAAATSWSPTAPRGAS